MFYKAVEPTHKTFDYVLVADKVDDDTDLKAQRQKAFIQQLEKKKISVTRILNDDKVFYGLHAPSEIFEEYKYLLKVSDSCNWCEDVQSGIPLATRNYFGEKVALYYLWLGRYTKLLIPAAVLGVIVFLYGLAFFNTNPLIHSLLGAVEENQGKNCFQVEGLRLLMLILGLAHILVVFRVVAAPLMSESNWDFIKDNATTVAVMLGAVLHYVTIQVMTRVSVYLFSEDLQTCNATFAWINGHPGDYVRIAGWRLEECHPSGCLTDLFIQMAVIMVLKQTLNNIFEFTVPWLKNCVRRNTAKKLQRKCGHCYKVCNYKQDCVELCDICKIQDWTRNYHLANTDAFSLFNEFLEMVVQFSFTTIFVAAFPLAPLLAFINNIFEIRLDAIKMVRLERRHVPRKTSDIGVWTKVLEGIGVLAVIANGLVIGFSSDFIPRLVYLHRYGPCANGITDTHCMQGYIKNTLSTAHLTHPAVQKDFLENQMVINNKINITQCSYKDYRSDDDYSLTAQFWVVLAVRLAFVILFEHVVVVCKFIAAWFIPDNPIQVKNNRLHDKLARLKAELREIKRINSTEVPQHLSTSLD
ncbi:hypothetical protein PAMP_000958 [Pampus punctatissimus]